MLLLVYFSYRSVGRAKSSPGKTTLGVPQGSFFGPILFLAYVNDFTINIHNNIRLFADDISLYKRDKRPNDHRIVQEDSNTVTNWQMIGWWNFISPSVKLCR